MAAISQATHHKKIIYLLPLRSPAEEKYRHFKNLYSSYGVEKYPEILKDVSLVIIDEMQAINHPKWGPLLEDIIEQLHKKELAHLRIIGLSAFIENQKALLKWFPARLLISHKSPVELRRGIVRKGIFKYITSKKKNIYQREVFFKPEAVRDNCFEDYLLETEGLKLI